MHELVIYRQKAELRMKKDLMIRKKEIQKCEEEANNKTETIVTLQRTRSREVATSGQGGRGRV